MRASRPLACLAAAAAGLVVVPPVSTASASSGVNWTYDTRPAGQPTTSDPAQTLTSATSSYGMGDVAVWGFSATIDLGATPTAETDARVHLVFGTATDSGCEPTWDHAWSTFAPTAGATRTDNQISVNMELSDDAPDSWSCGYVQVTDVTDQTVLDQLDGQSAPYESSPPLRFENSQRARLPVGRWSVVRLHLQIHDLDRLVIIGWGDDVKARKVVLGVEDLPDGRLTVRLPVKLLTHHRTRMGVQARSLSDGHGLPRVNAPVEIRPR